MPELRKQSSGPVSSKTALIRGGRRGNQPRESSHTKLWPKQRPEPANTILRAEFCDDRRSCRRSRKNSALKDIQIQALALAQARASLTFPRAGFPKCRPYPGRQERNPALGTSKYETLAQAKARACKILNVQQLQISCHPESYEGSPFSRLGLPS